MCKRYKVDATKRDVHGALIDSELLANVYLAMTGGQTALLLDEESPEQQDASPGAMPGRDAQRPTATPAFDLVIIKATADEIAAHNVMLEKIRESGACVWDID